MLKTLSRIYTDLGISLRLKRKYVINQAIPNIGRESKYHIKFITYTQKASKINIILESLFAFLELPTQVFNQIHTSIKYEKQMLKTESFLN